MATLLNILNNRAGDFALTCDGEVENGCWVDTTLGKDRISLDGIFTLSELETLVYWKKAREKP